MALEHQADHNHSVHSRVTSYDEPQPTSACDNQAGFSRLQHRSWDLWPYEDYRSQFKGSNFRTQRREINCHKGLKLIVLQREGGKSSTKEIGDPKSCLLLCHRQYQVLSRD